METKLDSRQGQFPASFPDTFKDFFAMMSEDEDNLDLFSNLLEDKVIPRANKFNQRRCGGSLRCPPTSKANNQNIVGRSNSFRVHRPNSTYNLGGGSSSFGASQLKKNINADSSQNNSSNSAFCKHIKYCCLHQQQRKTSITGSSQKPQHHYSHQNFLDYGNGCRTGPDGGDDNDDKNGEVNNGRILQNEQQLLQKQKPKQQQQQQQQVKTPARHSVILERAFDFDSCDDSDTISTTSSNPAIPYSVVAGHQSSLKQSQKLQSYQSRQHQHQQQQQKQQYQQRQQEQHQQTSTKDHYLHHPHHLLSVSHSHSYQLPSHGKQQTTTIHSHHIPAAKGSGFGTNGGGAYHSKETAIQRIVQQSGIRKADNSNSTAPAKTNINQSRYLGLSTNNINSICGTGTTGSSSGNSTGSGSNNSNCTYSSSCMNCSSNTDSGIANYNSISGSGSCCSSTKRAGSTGGLNRPLSNLYMDLNSPTAQLPMTTTETMQTTNKFNDMLTCGGQSGGGHSINSMRSQKSPILNRRRSSSIAINLLNPEKGYKNASDETLMRTHSTIPHSSTRERISHTKSPVNTKGKVPSIPVESGVLTFSQAISGAVSPQYSTTSPIHMIASDSDSNNALGSVTTATSGIASPTAAINPSATAGMNRASEEFFCGSSATIAQLGNKQKQRLRTSSMPAESRKPRLADTRRAAIHCADLDLEYYRLRSFSITSHGVCNLGDSLRSRRSRSINSVTSTTTSNSGKIRHDSNASRTSGDVIFEQEKDKRDANKCHIPAYKIAMLGSSGVGKSTLTYQFTTSEYICAYDLSLDDDYGQKTVSVLVDGIETDLEIIDHPACEMSTEAFCSTYNIDLFVVVYSVVDRNSFKAAEKILQYLKESEMLMTRGAILVGNKTDLERHREVNRQMGRKLAKDIVCKFIETSSGLDHNVDELLVGIVAQVKLNPQRVSNLSERDRQRLHLQNAIQKHRRMHMPARKIVRQLSMCQQDEGDCDDQNGDDGQNSKNNCPIDENQPPPKKDIIIKSCLKSELGPIRKTNKRTLNLESILKMGESELEDDDEGYRNTNRNRNTILTKKDILTTAKTFKASGNGNRTSNFSFSGSGGGGVTIHSSNSSPKSRHSYESSNQSGTTSTGSTNSNFRDISSQAETSLLDDCNRKTVSKLTNRTKIFLSSVLKFKRAINVKRRNSSSCSDLFVI